ncbi:DUF1971 domain-containing protein [Rhizobium sp. Leaf383]|uniref:DUF1971 domain-containing protein n=1 Tax=Rhizobium sp. Leaf383 TaxID=1736357 RepID=UPI000715E082|nr:DUF1971 domain-containing protein [Rhizobium sp. Leaf383]KQS76397.1 hypothetical protein ASG58_11265 [Rhizobium sp. Leaf383]
MPVELTETDISRILALFYERVRADTQLGPVFAVVGDWDEHMTRLSEFWSSMMLTTGRYKGNPLSMHLVHAKKFRPEMFGRWLEIWRQTTNELVAPEIAQAMQARATRIAARFSLMICGKELATNERSEVSPLPPVPYRVSRLFDERSLPRALLLDHALKQGTWGVVRVEEGSIHYLEAGVTEARALSPETPGVMPPLTSHRLELVGAVKLRVEFYDHYPLGTHHN